ncbi:bromodomain and WD repeat-containing protein 3-like [Haliotis rubra]|uniref:bromodomain and WD repeat-containing protein 3-like n=1 Tax=Haliotis rubra TaxID=36100 RepID=UPI001EE61CA4|nr:bromodomain and WD repeat-containing protein 3-like [Haliotis rubra]
MPTPESTVASVSTIESELYFLIARFLSSGPCKKASEVLLGELKEHKLLPKRIDWEAREHYRSYSNLIDLFRHISCGHLLSICERLGPLLDKEVPPSITGVRSLLGAGSLSLLRTVENSRQTKWASSQLAVLHHAEPLQPPRNIAHFSLCSMVKGRELTGRSRRDLIFPGHQYSHVSLHDRKLGHLSAVYCVSFDRTGQYIFTGADDHLVKIWSASAGRLLATFRGHAAEITDLAVNFENTLLACGSCDKIIRVWCLRTKAPVIVLQGHTGMITSVQFCPQAKGDTRYLATTGADGCVCFWQWNVNTLKFNTKPIKFVERSRAGAQMLCSSFSPGGLFLATGNTDNVIRVYFFHNTNPEKICELEAHKDRVDSITYSNQGMRFVSGSKDGTARIWRYERQEWKALVLNMATKMPSKSAPASVDPPPTDDSKKDKYRVTMVAWMMDDEHVVTAVSDYSLKVWASHTGRLVHVLESHQDEVFVLEPSPIDARILLSAGHDGNIVIWNLQTGNKIKTFFNMIEGQGHGAVFDCKFAPDGLSFAAVDSHGHLLMFGFGSNEKYQKVPKEVFFHTDYRPLIRDANNYVLDEQTQQPPHLMPPPFLVDIDGNPYRPITQRLVPGRENCKDEMLIPEVAVNEEGSSEVIGDGEPLGGPMPEPAVIERVRPSLDAMIQRLQLEQDHRIALEGGEPLASPPPVGSPPPFVSPRSTRNNQGRVGMRRSGETEGVRQSLGNVTLRATKSDIAALKRRVVVKPLDPEVMWRHEEKRLAFADEEFKKFVFERKKKPNSPHGTHSAASKDKRKQAQATGANTAENEETARNRLFTRALYDTEEEEDEEGNSSGSDFMHESDSDEYSDWMGDTGSNLQPPKRTSQRQRKRKRFTSTEDDPDDDDEDDDDDDNDKDNDQDSGQ